MSDSRPSCVQFRTPGRGGRAVIAAACGVALGAWMIAAATAAGPDDGKADPVPVKAPYTGTQRVKPATSEERTEDTNLYRQHLTTLSNPFFEGRAPGTKGNRLAAEYIESNLRQLGLTPAFPVEVKDDQGNVTSSTERATYRQVFTAPFSPRPGDSIKLTRQDVSYAPQGGAGVTLAAGKEFNALGFSGTGDVTAPLVFVGYACKNEDKKYEALPEGTKLDGKIAVVMRFEPMDEKGKSKWEDVRWSNAAALDAKLQLVQRAGAAGIILVSAPGADDERVGKLEGMELGGGSREGKLPIVMLSLDAADALVKAADSQHRSLMDLRRLADEAPVAIDLPDAPATLKVTTERVPLLTDNVGAILPGKGKLADEFIVIGSHYDHVGYGYIGAQPENRGKIHPGADDNGSGTSGNLLVAKKLAEAYEHLPEGAQARSILFLWFSAEESGLVGSRWYVNHPIVPLDKHALMLNMDMIGRLRDGKFEVGGVGSAEGLDTWTQPYWDEFGMKVKATRMGAPNSDHFSFQGKKIPNLFFFTGLHKEYHKPADVIETINFDGATQVADLVYRIALDAAERPEKFVFSDKPRDEDPADKKDGDKKDQPAVSTVAGTGVRFGIAPGDYSGEEKGVLIGEVFPELPAAKAGLKEGDLMVKWNDEVLTGVENWMPLLQKAKPGDVVKIVYKRKVDGEMKELTTEATLVARAGRPAQ